jgi:hypothetical protein
MKSILSESQLVLQTVWRSRQKASGLNENKKHDEILMLNTSSYIHCIFVYTAISIKIVHKQSGKVEYERERLLGIANKLMNFRSDSQQLFALVFDFSALLVDNLN